MAAGIVHHSVDKPSAFRGRVTLEQLLRLRRESVHIQARLGVERVNLTVVEPSAVGPMADEVRKEGAALMRDFPASTIATVLEGGGFRVAAARAIIGGLTLLAGERQRRRIFDSVDEAGKWLAERNAGKPEMQTQAVVELVERARAAISGNG